MGMSSIGKATPFFLKKIMDDSEYYSKLRAQYSHTTSITKNKNFNYTKWNSRQGREDAQMLQEKKEKDNQDSETVSSEES